MSETGHLEGGAAILVKPKLTREPYEITTKLDTETTYENTYTYTRSCTPDQTCTTPGNDNNNKPNQPKDFIRQSLLAALEKESKQDRYEIKKELGRGGEGVVFLAYDKDLRRHVAIKFKLGQTEEAARRFLEGAQFNAGLSHPNIVQIHDLGATENGEIYIIMELLIGETLDKIIKRLKENDIETQQQYTRTRLLDIFEEICEGVAFAHKQDTIHRDLKPANIHIQEGEITKIMDFGLASSGSATTKRKNEINGTPQYMSPEQAQGLADKINQATDIYSLGVILYELMTFKKPFTGNNTQEVLYQVINKNPEKPTEITPDLDPTIGNIILTALQKSPENRFKNAGEMLETIHNYIYGITAKQEADKHAKEAQKLLETYEKLENIFKEDLKELKNLIKNYNNSNETQKQNGKKTAITHKEKELQGQQAQIEILEKGIRDHCLRAVQKFGKHPEANQTLAQVYFKRFLKAETENDSNNMDTFKQLAQNYDLDNKLDFESKGNIELEITPVSADVTLYKYEEDAEGMIKPEKISSHEIQNGNLKLNQLPMGSYLIKIKSKDQSYKTISYSITLTGNKQTKINIKLRKNTEIPENFIHIPAGNFNYEQPHAYKSKLFPELNEPSKIDSPDFAISKYHVTIAEYGKFLQYLYDTDQYEELQKHVPRIENPNNITKIEKLPPILKISKQIPGLKNLSKKITPNINFTNSFFGLKNGKICIVPDNEGDEMDPQFAIYGVNLHDAQKYCDWRSKQDNCIYRIPTDKEYTIAARGEDKRKYPWGNEFSPELCNIANGKKFPSKVGAYSTDQSIHGIYDIAGGMSDFTDTPTNQDLTWVRGGSWGCGEERSPLDFRLPCSPITRASTVSFRLVKELHN